MSQNRIWLSPPHMGGDELGFIQEAFVTNWVAPAGPHITAFENELAAYNEVSYCAAISSGTAAIHLALIILGVKAGDEVLCSSFTFSGSCNPIMYQHGTPVFIDSERETWNMDPTLLEDAIADRLKKTGRKPKAIIVVHLYGMPARIDEIMMIARRYDIPVIEDAAEALGSEFNGKKLGTFGDMGIFSFNGNKIITTSGGGALVSEKEEWITKARFLATQARDPAPHYEHSHVGYNYRLSNISAAIGRGQLRVLDLRVQQRRSVYDYYFNSLSGLAGVSFLPERQGHFSNRWLTTISIDTKFTTFGRDVETLRLRLEKEGIESRPLWKPMHLQPIFKDAVSYLNGVSEQLFVNGLCLPSGSSLLREEQARICQLIEDILVTK